MGDVHRSLLDLQRALYNVEVYLKKITGSAPVKQPAVRLQRGQCYPAYGPTSPTQFNVLKEISKQLGITFAWKGSATDYRASQENIPDISFAIVYDSGGSRIASTKFGHDSFIGNNIFVIILQLESVPRIVPEGLQKNLKQDYLNANVVRDIFIFKIPNINAQMLPSSDYNNAQLVRFKEWFQ